MISDTNEEIYIFDEDAPVQELSEMDEATEQAKESMMTVKMDCHVEVRPEKILQAIVEWIRRMLRR